MSQQIIQHIISYLNR